jgi:tRNA(Arg) A34 adenosine deaminase TadA
MRSSPSREQIIRHLRHTHTVAQRAVADGHHPFGAILVAPDHETVVMTQGNIDTVRHAESELARRAASQLSPEDLWHHTLYTSVEPCAMCAGTQYWANIGRLIYGITERKLLSVTGAHQDNPTLDVPSRYIFDRGQKQVEVIGPIAEVQEEIVTLHRSFWT